MIRILLVLLLITTPAFAEWDVNIPLAADNLTDFPVDNQENLDRLELVLREYPKGITLSYTSGSTITASTGGIVCADSAGTTKKFRGNTSTTAITFSDIDTGAEASGTTYYVYANCDATATTATFKISASSTTPSGLTSYKRIGSFYNDSSSNITLIDNDAQYSEVGSPSSKSLDTIYQALTDGYVSAISYISSPSGGPTSLIGYLGYTDSSSSPTTLMCVGSTRNWSSNSQFSYGSSCKMLVRKGDYYKITRTVFEGSETSSTMYFVPLQ